MSVPLSHVQNGSTTVASVSYSLDNVGNRTQRVDQQGTHSYGYDNLYRLTSVTYPGPSTTTYSFDAFGNRTSLTDGSGVTSYAYDDADRITSVTPPSPAPAVSYTWDNNGNLTNRGSDSFSWDYEDRMTSATVNSVTSTFAYRGDGLRNRRTTGGVTTTFTWDIAAGLPVVLDDGNQYVYGAGLTAMKQSGSWYYYLADGLGSTMAIVDASGTVQKSYTYDVYGKPTATGTLPNEFDFAGQQTDPTGLQYLRARYMDPATGTFASRDPLGAVPPWLGSLRLRERQSIDTYRRFRAFPLSGMWQGQGSRKGGCECDVCRCRGPLARRVGSRTDGLGRPDRHFGHCGSWAATGLVYGAASGGLPGAAGGAIAGCAMGAVSRLASHVDGPVGAGLQCLTWAVGTGLTGGGRIGTAAACLAGIAGTLANGQGDQCAIWATAGLVSGAAKLASTGRSGLPALGAAAGCVAGMVTSGPPQVMAIGGKAGG